jgi:peptide/nickel transport system ATP-binding protein
VMVMYAGQIIEKAEVKELFKNPCHPYTRGLLDSVPHFESGQSLQRLQTIPGMVPSLMNLPQGCRFHDRCQWSETSCRQGNPSLVEVTPGSNHYVACHLQTKKLQETESVGFYE